ncbi:hypothetical protein GJ631_03190 [Natronomonas sp. CBA1123]|uniref:DUF7123 family protein n=1 Tax=Natronomonas sp. CBA1123 TaxID=2668070 RepID=UPI0012E9A64B|nr:hypothetical protein [Natronomonas sp. CBA1123]
MTMRQQTHPAGRLLEYLERRAADGEIYVKSKFLAEDLDLSASQIGVLLGRLQDSAETLDIEQWSYTNATTWRIAPAE